MADVQSFSNLFLRAERTPQRYVCVLPMNKTPNELQEEIVALQVALDVKDRCDDAAKRMEICKLMLSMIQRIKSQLEDEIGS